MVESFSQLPSLLRILVVVACSLLQDNELAILRGELNEEEVGFVQSVDSLAGNRSGMAQLFRTNRATAESTFVKIESYYMGNHEGMAPTWLARLNTLARALDDTGNTARWSNRLAMVVALPEADRVARRQAMQNLSTAKALRELALEEWPDLTKLMQSKENLASARAVFDRLQDIEQLARVHLLLAMNASTEKDHQLVYDQVVIAKNYWKKVGLPNDDDGYRWMIDQELLLRRSGIGPPLVDEAPKPKPEVKGDDWTPVPMQLRKNEKIGTLKVPSFADDDPRTWPSFTIAGNNSYPFPPGFQPLGRSIQVIRDNSTYLLDVYGDRKSAETIPLHPGRAETVTIRDNKREPASRQYVFSLALAGQESSFGITVPNAPTKDRAVLRYRTACQLEGERDGQKWVLIDDNDSGQFGDVIEHSDHYGGPEQSFSMPDTVFVGSMERSIPFSEYLVLDATPLRLRVDPKTYALLWQSAAMSMGKVTLDWSGPVKPESLVIVGQAERKMCAYDLMSAATVTVAAGRYRLAYGVMATGKGSTAQRAMILPGRSPVIDVADGATVSVALGAPFKLEFETKAEGEEVVLQGTSVHVVGRLQEFYLRFTEVLRPQLTAKTKSGTLLERSRTMEASSREDWSKSSRSAAFPKDFRVKRDPQDSIQWQLQLRSHPLFGGPLESDWK